MNRNCPLALFSAPSISCQEALGAGLFACFADDGGTSHLLRDARQGVFFAPRDPDDLAEKLAGACRTVGGRPVDQREVCRAEMAEASRWLGYDRLTAWMMDLIADRRAETGKAGA